MPNAYRRRAYANQDGLWRKAGVQRLPYSEWKKTQRAIQSASSRRGTRIPTAYPARKSRIPTAYPSTKYSYSRPGPVGTAGRAIGSAIGGYIGGPVGATLGNAAGGLAHYIGRIFGSGDYKMAGPVKDNSIMNTSSTVPAFGTGKTQIRVRHREFLGDVFSSATASTFDINAFDINPGVSQTFPWLSQVCGATFQQYRLNGMVFEFVSMSGESLNSVNTALGSVVMATDYDSADAPFTNKQQMENTEFGISSKPSCNLLHPIECQRSVTPVSELYVRAFSNPTGTDIRLYDMGRYYIATTGCQGTSVNLGELWVSYDVTLFKSIEQPPMYIAPSDYYKQFTGIDATHALGTSQVSVLNQIGTSISYVAGTAIVTFPIGIQVNSIYAVSYQVFGDSTAGVAIVSPVCSNGLIIYGSLLQSPTPATGTQTTRGFSCLVQYVGGGLPATPPQMAITGGVVPANIILSYLSINQVTSLSPQNVFI